MAEDPTSPVAEDLRNEGITEEVAEAVLLLTNDKKGSYEDFIERTAKNPIALRVKLANLEDNMNSLRLREVTIVDLERIAKYHRAWISLKTKHYK